MNINPREISNFQKTMKAKEFSCDFHQFAKNINYDIIEIHNRPLILDELIRNINSRYIMYFHNDPLSMPH